MAWKALLACKRSEAFDLIALGLGLGLNEQIKKNLIEFSIWFIMIVKNLAPYFTNGLEFFLFDQRQIGSTSRTLFFIAFIIAAAELSNLQLIISISHYQRIMVCPFLFAFIGNKHFWHWMLFLWKKKLTEMLFTSWTRA